MKKFVKVYNLGCDGWKKEYLCTVFMPEEYINSIESQDSSSIVTLNNDGGEFLDNKLKEYSYGYLRLEISTEEEKEQRIQVLQREIEKLQNELNELKGE